MRSQTLALCLMLSSLLLTGCGGVEVVETRLKVPGHLLTCQAEPEPPIEMTGQAVAGFIVDLAEAGEDCRRRLGAVQRILDGQ